MLDIAKERSVWEEAAAKVPLPPGVEARGEYADGVYCLWVSGTGADVSKVLLFVHGGGFNSGSCITHRDLASRLSLAAGVPVLLVNYRLAPEDPFPAGLDDVVRVYRWLLNSGYNAGDIAVGGDSSGGNLALAALVRLRAEAVALPSSMLLLSPWLDLTLSGKSLTGNADKDNIVSKEDLQATREVYIGMRDPSDPLISPLMSDPAGLPPVEIYVGGDEALLSDSERFVLRAKEAGVEATLHVYEGMWHVFPAYAGALPVGQQAIEQMGFFLQEKLGIGNTSEEN